MDVASQNPSQLNGLLLKKVHCANNIVLNKKRKLQDEQLGSPLSKHKCLDRSYASEHGTPSFTAGPRAYEASNKCEKKGKGKEVLGDDESGLSIAKDSNHLFEGSFSAMAANAGAKEGPEYVEACSYNHPYASSGSCSSNSSKTTRYSLDSGKTIGPSAGKETCTMNRAIPNLEGVVHFEPEYQNYEDPSYADNIFYEYKNKGIELDEDPEDMMLYSNGATSNMYVLSSGRQNVNQETKGRPKKLTIDQEFEQYFSTLML